ncbi:uncharacterized protein METZ01_LOCUS134156 [marine metagenome]|jgi:hypothetical protein|uniref:Uncharacterized protein n=1 Tax=marine metagenome TaxID=408172 RepID=A0A381YXF5_9ZZZZ|tara:strand:+ start:138 stop:473 length:336 start_codon:yes stop_codon:yes gene_type:complete
MNPYSQKAYDEGIQKRIEEEPPVPKIPRGPWIMDGLPTPSDDFPRSIKPHIAMITFKIDIRAMNIDETLDIQVMGNKALEKYGMAQKGQFVIKGISEADCIQKIKNLLEKF